MRARKHILLVDDDKDTCTVMSILLRHAGYDVVTSTTLADAASLAGNLRFDIYILDNWFPDGNGVDLCRYIRAFDPATPIVFHSGVVGQGERDEAIIAGAQAYLIKPVDIDLLKNTVSHLVGRSRAA
jgi:DNA-binding response OmpR family regulator